MERRGYKRKYLEKLVEERLKKIRNELFVINIANDSDDSDATESNQETIDDNLNDELKKFESATELHDYDESSIHENDNIEDSDKDEGEIMNNENKDERISPKLNVVKRELTEITLTQRPILGTGEHMYCPIVITDDDIDLNIDEHGLEMVHIPYQKPVVVNLDSSDEEVSITFVEHVTEESQESDLTDKEESCCLKDESINENLPDKGEQHSNSKEIYDLNIDKDSQCQIVESVKEIEQNIVICNYDFSEKECDKNIAVDTMKDNFDNLYKKLSIPKALSLLGCSNYMEHEHVNLSECIKNNKRMLAPDFLGIVKRKFDSNKENDENGGKNHESQNKDKKNVSDAVHVSKRPRNSFSRYLDTIKNNNLNIKKSDVNHCQDSGEGAKVQSDTEGQVEPKIALNEDEKRQEMSLKRCALKEDINMKQDKYNCVPKLNGQEQDNFEDGKENDKDDNIQDVHRSTLKKDVKIGQDKSNSVPEENNKEQDNSEIVLNEYGKEVDKTDNVTKQDELGPVILGCTQKTDGSLPKENGKEKAIAENLQHEDDKSEYENECLLFEGDIGHGESGLTLPEYDKEKYRCFLNGNEHKDEEIYGCENSIPLSERNKPPQDSQNTSSDINKEIDPVSTILDKVEGETFKYQDETYLVLSSSESEVEEINDFTNESTDNKLHKMNRIHNLDRHQLDRIKSPIDDQESYTISESDSSFTSSEATINETVVEIEDDTSSEPEQGEQKHSTSKIYPAKKSDVDDKISSRKSMELSIVNKKHSKKEKENLSRKIEKFINANNEVHEKEMTKYYIKKSLDDQEDDHKKDAIHGNNIIKSEDGTSEETSEVVLEVDPLDEIERAFDSPCRYQDNDSYKDKSTTLRLPSLRHLRPDERIRTIYSKSSKNYSPSKYNKTARSVDELDEYINSRRIDEVETESHLYEKYNQYDKSNHYPFNVSVQQRRPSVWERLDLERNYTLAVTVQSADAMQKKNRTEDDLISAEISPVKRIVVMKPKCGNNGKEIENYDIENKKPQSPNFDYVQVPQESLHLIPVHGSRVQQMNVKNKFLSRRRHISTPSCIVPLKEMQSSSRISQSAKTLNVSYQNSDIKSQTVTEIEPYKTQKPIGSEVGEVPFGNPDSNAVQSNSGLDFFNEFGEKRKYNIQSNKQSMSGIGQSHNTIRASNSDLVNPEQESTYNDGEFTPCKVPLNMKIRLTKFIRCEDCGHESRKRKSMVRHFKNTIHKSASLYELNDANVFEKQENFVVNKIRPFDELVHICPVSGCENVFLCRADCVHHYQKDHMKTDQVYCTAIIQKEELCRIRCFYSMFECNVCGNVFADGINLDHHSQNSLHPLFHKYKGTFRIFVCHGCHEFFTGFISAVDHKCMKTSPAYIALRLLHVSKQSKETWVKVAKKWTKVTSRLDTVSWS